MNDFTDQYKSIMTTIDYTGLPYWDLCAALRLSKFPEWGLEKSIEKTMREKQKRFVSQALNEWNVYES